jgi:hypothetical protein
VDRVTPDAVILAGCLVACGLSALALVLLASPDSFLSRLVDAPGETTREVPTS